MIAGMDSTVIIAGICIAIILCIALGIVIRKRIAATRIKRQVLSAEPFKTPLRIQKMDAGTQGLPADREMTADRRPQRSEIDCIEGMKDISESLVALGKKYAAEGITLATSDGLLLASSERTPDAAEIARYCNIYRNNPRTLPDGILLFGVEHKGSSLIGIIQRKRAGLQEPETELIRDTKDILNWWI